LMLPQTDDSTHDVSKAPINLSITEDKVYYIDRQAVPFPVLEQTLLDATAGMEEPTVILRAASILTIQDLVDVMSLGARLRIRMVLATEQN
jgi:biopolymer transport protein ExbD